MKKTKVIFTDLRWRKEQADLGTLTTKLGKRLKDVHAALGRLDVSDFRTDVAYCAEQAFSDLNLEHIAHIGETAEGIDSIVDSYLGIEGKVGKGYLPEGAAKVKNVKRCMKLYGALLAAVLAENYAHFVQDSAVFEKSLKKNNLIDIEESREVLGKTLAMYQEVSKQAKARSIPVKKRLEKRIRKYAANFARVDELAAELTGIMQKFADTEWGENNERQLKKLQNRFFRQWFFRQGLIAKCEKARYPEGTTLSEAVCSDMEYVGNNLQDVSEMRTDIKRGIARLDSYAKEIAETGASAAGIARIQEIAAQADHLEYQSIQDNFYFSGLVDKYAVDCEELRDLAGRKMQQINSECVKRFSVLENSGAEDMELEHLQRVFDELGNHEVSGRITLLRRRMNQDSGFFSMVNYLNQTSCPPRYLILGDTLLGRNRERDWVERIAVFSKTLEGMNCSSDEEKTWLKHARYAINEDSARGYLRQKVAGSKHMKCAVDLALFAIDDKLDTL